MNWHQIESMDLQFWCKYAYICKLYSNAYLVVCSTVYVQSNAVCYIYNQKKCLELILIFSQDGVYMYIHDMYSLLG